MLKDIIGIVHELTDTHREIYDISLEKKDAVVANDVQRVAEIVKQEWELLGKVSELEEKRIQMVCEMARVKDVEDASGLSLQDIRLWGTAEEADSLDAAAEELRELVGEQKKINAENQALIGLHLDYMDYMINVFLKEPQASNIYGNSGEVEEEGMNNRGIIDSRV